MIVTVSTALYTAAFGIFILSLSRYFSRRRLPPSPRGLPLLGNIFQVGSDGETKLWHTFGNWGKLYGPIVYLKFADQDVVLLNNIARSTELLDRRSTLYSDRPKCVVLDYLVSKDYHQIQANEAVLLVNDLLSLSSSKESYGKPVDVLTGKHPLPGKKSLISVIERCVSGFVHLRCSL
ncbi:hypothetical protein BT96DRAFT_575428 [Gymnopus androsaceus JB14]|uniref:Cytochrome P450 n=1 Tax=Gymnopus androsaceus JB14 TaxID=1447944 RepID=A0A6A4GJ10_9AGAR|nr:hypothetical protein BT96DRAFT_575428 [Gymnopus androsaceus JB14]